MIKIFKKDETNFTHDGIEVLDDIVISSYTSWSENSKWIGETKVKKDFDKSEIIKEEMILELPTEKGPQLFRILKLNKKNNKYITATSQHIGFDFENNFIQDINIVNKSGRAAIEQIQDGTTFNNKFNLSSNIDTVASARMVRKNGITALLGSEDNTFINRWGGYLVLDNLNISMNKSVGEDRGVEILVGKNLTDMEGTIDISNVCTGINAIAFDGVTLPEGIYYSPLLKNYSEPHIKEFKFDDIKYKYSDNNSNEEGYETLEEVYAAIRKECDKLFNESNIDKPSCNLRVSIVDLAQTDQYKGDELNERIYQGDTLTANLEEYGFNVKLKMTANKYDNVKDRYDDIDLGDAKLNVFNSVSNVQGTIDKVVDQLGGNTWQDILDKSMQEATQLIEAGIKDSYVVARKNELLIMDNPLLESAINVVRMNKNGIAFSKTGYSGPFTSAWTIDGKFNASFIATGELNAALIKTGILMSANNRTWIDMEQGTFNFHDKIKFDGTNFEIELKDLDVETQVNNAIKPLVDELTQFKNDVNSVIKDGIISEAEIITIANSIDALNKEKAELIARYNAIYNNSKLTGLARTNLSDKYNAFITAHNNLINNINSMISDKIATDIEKTEYKNKLTLYSNSLAELSKAFDNAIYNISLNDAIAADEALKNTLQGNIDEVKKVANDTATAIGNYTADSILDEAEKESIKTYLKSLATEKADIDKEYTTLYNNVDLINAYKTNLKTAYDNYILKYNDLISKINTLLSANPITDTMRTNINNAFITHDTYLATYSQSVNEAITSISEKKKQDAINTSNNYYDTQIKLDKQSLTATFTELHNGGYTQGITTVNKDGIQVSHNNVSSKTKMSADGFSIVDENDDVLAWLSSKKQWTELNVDKIFATNVVPIYIGDTNIYIDHAYTGDCLGTSAQPFNSFSLLQQAINNHCIINDLYIYIKTTSIEITEQLFLSNLSGNAEIFIVYSSTCIHRCRDNSNYSINISGCTALISIDGGKTVSSNSVNGALICEDNNRHGINIVNCKYVYIKNISINVTNAGVYVRRSTVHTSNIDFGKTYCCLLVQDCSNVRDSGSCGGGSQAYKVHSGSHVIIGSVETGQQIPKGNGLQYGGVIHNLGNVTTTDSYRFPTTSATPSVPTMSTYSQSFGWTSHKTYQYSWSSWGDSDCKQGSWGYGLRGGHMFFDIGAIRSFLSGTVLDGNTITLTRASSGGLSGASNVYINGSTCSSASGTPGYSNQTLLGTLAWGETKTFTLPKSIVQSLKSGTCSSLAVYVNNTSQSNYINIVNCNITLKVSK